MKTNNLCKTALLVILGISVLLLTQCELFLGDNADGNVGIDLSQFYGSDRAISHIPEGVTITSFRVSVFGPGMEPMRKTVSYGTRYVNLQVPAGQDRNFTLEVFFNSDPDLYQHPYILSFKGRATADLRTGAKVGVLFKMTAGATTILVPDPKPSSEGRIYIANDMSFTGMTYGRMNRTLNPDDMDVAADGTIFASSRSNAWCAAYADEIVLGTGQNGTITWPDSDDAYAAAMDRDASFDINGGSSVLETNIFYFGTANTLGYSVIDDSVHTATLPTNGITMESPQLDNIYGIAVDPFTHYLYLVGATTLNGPAIVKYNPDHYVDVTKKAGEVLDAVRGHPLFYRLNDVIIKDDLVFVLNDLDTSKAPAEQPPVILVFDRNLNYLRGFGRMSYIQGSGITRSFAPGDFYHPKRFICQENDGLYIVDDGPGFDKIVHIDVSLDPATWSTFPDDDKEIEVFDFEE